MIHLFRHVIGVLRVAALWLLAVCVLLGPSASGVSAAFAAGSETCGVSCPCDEAALDDHAEEQHEQAGACECDDEESGGSQHDEGDPCEDGCPDDCPNCHCCLGIGMAILPFPLTSGTVTCTAAAMPVLIEVLASGTHTGVFRPPRSLT